MLEQNIAFVLSVSRILFLTVSLAPSNIYPHSKVHNATRPIQEVQQLNLRCWLNRKRELIQVLVLDWVQNLANDIKRSQI